MTSIIERTPALIRYACGREICRATAAGMREYMNRRDLAWTRDEGRCCLCSQPLSLAEATVEHLNPKGIGGSKHDDRLPNIGVSHWNGNAKKGSISYQKYMERPLDKRILACRGGR